MILIAFYDPGKCHIFTIEKWWIKSWNLYNKWTECLLGSEPPLGGRQSGPPRVCSAEKTCYIYDALSFLTFAYWCCYKTVFATQNNINKTEMCWEINKRQKCRTQMPWREFGWLLKTNKMWSGIITVSHTGFFLRAY